MSHHHVTSLFRGAQKNKVIKIIYSSEGFQTQSSKLCSTMCLKQSEKDWKRKQLLLAPNGMFLSRKNFFSACSLGLQPSSLAMENSLVHLEVDKKLLLSHFLSNKLLYDLLFCCSFKSSKLRSTAWSRSWYFTWQSLSGVW